MSAKKKNILFLGFVALGVLILGAVMAVVMGRISLFIGGWIIAAGATGYFVGTWLSKISQ